MFRPRSETGVVGGGGRGEPAGREGGERRREEGGGVWLGIVKNFLPLPLFPAS